MSYYNVRETHELRGKIIEIISKDPNLNKKKAIVEDWCCNMSGKKCTDNCTANNYACMNYVLREDKYSLPTDNNVVYVKTLDDNLGYIIHQSEINKDIKDNTEYTKEENKFVKFIKNILNVNN